MCGGVGVWVGGCVGVWVCGWKWINRLCNLALIFTGVTVVALAYVTSAVVLCDLGHHHVPYRVPGGEERLPGAVHSR